MGATLGTGLGVHISLFLYLGMLGAALLSVAWKPQLGVYLLILIIPLQTTRSKLGEFPGGAQIIDILWFSALLGMLFRKNGSLIPKNRMSGVLGAFAVLTYLSLWRGWFYLGGAPPLFSSDQRFSDWKNYMVMPIIALVVAAALRSTKQLKVAVMLMGLATCVVNWSFFRSTAGRDFSHFSYDVRDAGVLGYAGVNGFAAYVSEAIVFCVVLFFFVNEKKIRLALVGVAGIAVYCLLFSFSRGGYLATLAGISFFSVFRQKKILLGVFALLVTWQIILPTAVRERINMTYDTSGQVLDSSAATRVDLWQDAVGLITANPIEGTGFDTYQFMHRIAQYEDTHNYYIKVLVEMGGIGFILILFLLWKMGRLGMQLFHVADDPFLKGIGLGFAAVVVCAAVANLFGDRWTYTQVDGYIWVLMGCVIRGQQLAEQEKSEHSPEDSEFVLEERNDFATVS